MTLDEIPVAPPSLAQIQALLLQERAIMLAEMSRLKDMISALQTDKKKTVNS